VFLKSEIIIRYLAKKRWLTGIAEISHLASGEYNENYIVKSSSGNYVFRINHGSQLFIDNQIEYEFNVLKSLENSGVTPIPFFYDSNAAGFAGGVLLMEFIHGKPLNYKTDSDKAALIFSTIHNLPCDSRLIVQKNPVRDICAESLKLINMNSSPEYSAVRSLLLNYHDEMMKLSEREKDLFSNERLCTVNSEVNSGNFIISETRSVLVDWEKSVVSYRYQDLGHFLVPTTTLWKTDFRFTHEQKADFIKSYLRYSGLDIGIDEMFYKTEILEKVILLRALSWCYMAYEQYVNESKNLTHDETFDKIKYYLDNAECFLKS
jgi:thiamine kinase-like enzyme